MMKSRNPINGAEKSIRDHRQKVLFVSFLALFLANCSSNRMSSSQPTSLEPLPAHNPVLEQGSATAPSTLAEPENEANTAAVEMKAQGPRLILHQIECPPDEAPYVSEFKVNTFEIGIRWNIPGGLQNPELYSRYRCIPR